jgi:WD40 repeat protein
MTLISLSISLLVGGAEISPSQTIQTEHRVSSIALLPDGTKLLAAGPHGVVSLWETAGPTLVRYLKGSTDDTTSAALSPDGRLAAIGGIEGEVRVFDLQQGKVIRSHGEHGSRVQRVAFSPDGQWIVSTCWDGVVRVWSAVDGKPIQSTQGTPIGMGGIAFAGDELPCLFPGLYKDYPGHPGLLQEAPIRRWSPITQRTADLDRSATFWVIAQKEGRIAAGTDDGRIFLWKPNSDSASQWSIVDPTTPAIGRGLIGLEWLGNDHLFAMTMNGQGGVFDLAGQLQATLKRPTDGFVAVSVASQSSLLALGRWDKKLELFDLSAWKKP